MAGGEIASLFVKIGVDYKDFEAGLNDVSATLDSLGSQLSSIGAQMTLGITLPLVGIGKAAAQSAIDLDREMRNIQSISKQSDGDIAALQQRFIDLSTDINATTDSAVNLAAGFYQIQSSGFAGEDAMTVLLASTKAASAGLTDTATAAYVITAALNAYGESASAASQYSDTMFRAVDVGVMTFEELASSIGNVISTASTAGVSFEVVAASMATMTKQGLSAAEASVSLNQVLLSFIDPSKAMTKALEEIGFASGQAALDTLGLQGVLNALTDAGYNSTEAMATLFPNVRALRGALSLTGESAQMFAQDLDAIASSVGATEAAFAIQTKSMAAQMANLRNIATALGIEMFNTVAPSLREVGLSAADMLQSFRDLDPAMQKSIVNWGMAAAAAGPLLMVMGRLVTAASSLMSVLATPAGAVVGSLLGIAAGVNAIAGAMRAAEQAGWDQFFGGFAESGATAGEIAGAYAERMAEISARTADLIPRTTSLADTTKQHADATGQAVQAIFEASSNYIEYSNAMDIAGQSAQALSQDVWMAAKGITAQTDAMIQQAAAILDSSINYEQYAANLQKAGLAEYAVTEAAYASVKAHSELADSMDGVSAAAAAQAEKLANNQATANTVLQVMEALGVSQAQIDQGMSALNDTLGLSAAQQDKSAQSMAALTAAWSAGLLSTDYYTEAVLAAAQGTKTLSDAQLAAIDSALASAAATQQAAAAAQALKLQQLELSQSLINATPQQAAGAALDMLRGSYDAGVISLDQYAKGTQDIGLAFDLMSEKSINTAVGLSQLNQLAEAGVIPMGSMAEAVQMVLDQAKKGPVDLLEIANALSNIPSAADAAANGLHNTSEGLDNLSEGVQKMDENVGKELQTTLETLTTQIEGLDGRTVSVKMESKGFSQVVTLAEQVASALGSIPTSITVTITVIKTEVSGGAFNNLSESGQAGGIDLSGLPSQGSFGGGSSFSGGAGFSAANQSIGAPTGTLSGGASLNEAPTLVSNDTYNIFNPLAAAILLEQRHLANLAEAERALR